MAEDPSLDPRPKGSPLRTGIQVAITACAVLFGPTWSLAQEDAITALDNDVVSVVLRDLTTYRGDDAIIDGFGPSLPIPVLRKPMNGPVSSETERCGLEKKSWSRLTTREQRATKEAAKRLRERAVRAVAAGEFQIKVSGVEMRDEHQKPARSDVMFDRAIDVTLPGYSSSGRIAMVLVGVPWSIHSAGGTYVLRRESSTWRVVVRQFWVSF